MAKQPSKKLHEQEHPDIDLSDLILPNGLIDASWHNNAMPIFHTSLVDPHKQVTIDESTSKPPYAHEHRAVLSIQTKNPEEREYNDPDHIKLGWNNRFGVSLEFVENGILMEPPPPLARYTWSGEDEGMAYKVLLAFQYAANVWAELDGQYRGEPAAWDEMTLQFSRETIPYFAGEPEKQDFTPTNFAADYCDDNMALLNAFVSIYGENPLDSDEQDMSIRYDLGDPPHQVEMDEAREIAIKMIFIPEGKIQNDVRSMYDAAKWDTVDGLQTAGGNVLPIYKIKDRGFMVVASTPEGEEVTRPDAPVYFALYVSEAMDGKHLIKTFPNSRKALEFVKEFEDDILKAFFLYGEVNNASIMPSNIPDEPLTVSPAFKTNIKTQTVEYQGIDQLVLESGHVVMIGSEDLSVWENMDRFQEGSAPDNSIDFLDKSNDEGS
tara:strand:- start:312 stop:1619 length:1308 start_codon:yes stop_codon:yes gene_type:complete